MITLFRKLRRQLLEEKKVVNYLLYASGEIVLVVIGILIALAINNSEQRSLLQKKEQTYLQGLHKEFTTSKQKLEKLIEVNKNNLKGAQDIFAMIHQDSIPWDEARMSHLLMNTFAMDVAYNPNTSLLEEMVNSGSLKDLKNVNLRMALTNWVSTLEDIGKQEYDLAQQRNKVLDLFRNESASIRTIFDDAGVTTKELNLKASSNHVSNSDLVHSRVFENNVLLFMSATTATGSSHYEPLLESINQILELLVSEIDSSK